MIFKGPQKSHFDLVREFMVACSQIVRDHINLGTRKEQRFRLDLIREETKELEDALKANDPIAVADALADLEYVVLGTAVQFGIPQHTTFAEVHRSNMTKRGGEVRGDGKVLKPSWYEAPDLARVLGLKYRKGECPRCTTWHGVITTGSELAQCPECLGRYKP